MFEVMGCNSRLHLIAGPVDSRVNTPPYTEWMPWLLLHMDLRELEGPVRFITSSVTQYSTFDSPPGVRKLHRVGDPRLLAEHLFREHVAGASTLIPQVSMTSVAGGRIQRTSSPAKPYWQKEHLPRHVPGPAI